ncbi:unnamed protein product [Nippostrongylus brasiliensis]|uniref:Phlebovirus_G2 domain-containing protein n=1 Tax=Nippostrongylus brasiliensis TaxID=27835 RepID=A0A0N4YBX9_NIPBR|nr:unnamed protein product [Nippostrongylus brasiliensis]
MLVPLRNCNISISTYLYWTFPTRNYTTLHNTKVDLKKSIELSSNDRKTSQKRLQKIDQKTSNLCNNSGHIPKEEEKKKNIWNSSDCQSLYLSCALMFRHTCLLLKNKENRVKATGAIRLYQISHICKQKTEYFTRDHQFVTESIHQCYNAGICKNEVCTSIKPEERISEFSPMSNSNPGYTFCVPSCGCFWCNWCFHCKSTCLFYRCYATSTSSTVYRIFSCPTWSIQAEGIITLRSEDSTTFQKFTLQPGIPFVWNKLQLTLAGTITPDLPILSGYFITDDEIVSRIDPSPQGHLLPNSPGQLQCKTKEDAVTFKKCIFANHACSCTTREYTAHSSCTKWNNVIISVQQPQ